MTPDQDGPLAKPVPREPVSRLGRARRWIVGALAVYAVLGWAVVRYSPRPHTVLHTRSGEVKLVGAKPFADGGSRRLQLYIDGAGDEARAAEILVSVMPITQRMISARSVSRSPRSKGSGP